MKRREDEMNHRRTKAVAQMADRRQGRADRPAFTLIEMLVVVALSSIVMSVIVAVFVALIQQDRQVRLFGIRSERQGDLAEMIRVDIRAADEVSLAAQTVILIEGPDKRQTRYELTAGGCRRIVSDPRLEKPRVDFYAIGPAIAWSLKQGPSGRRPLYITSLHRSTKSEQQLSAMPFFVYAALGADLPDAP
jgi:prepilin-type N-terminal cleavage/methylation domain-containing protein